MVCCNMICLELYSFNLRIYLSLYTNRLQNYSSEYPKQASFVHWSNGNMQNERTRSLTDPTRLSRHSLEVPRFKFRREVMWNAIWRFNQAKNCKKHTPFLDNPSQLRTSMKFLLVVKGMAQNGTQNHKISGSPLNQNHPGITWPLTTEFSISHFFWLTVASTKHILISSYIHFCLSQFKYEVPQILIFLTYFWYLPIRSPSNVPSLTATSPKPRAAWNFSRLVSFSLWTIGQTFSATCQLARRGRVDGETQGQRNGETLPWNHWWDLWFQSIYRSMYVCII